ncbi:MAG TPA: hypothetical protein VD995_18370 [Azospirillum sp.]|nr:hypothetical protein [Azospirillum sp.]
MSDDFYRAHRTARDAPDAPDAIARLRTYLLSRPSESWLFFFAGIVAGALLG